MDQNFINAIGKLMAMHNEINRILDITESSKTFEDTHAYRVLEKINEKIDIAIGDLEYFSKPKKEGYLIKLPNDKFELRTKKGKPIRYFSCGSPIEVYSKETGEWCVGRVEYSNDKGGYYFYNNYLGHPALLEGMKARVRTEV